MPLNNFDRAIFRRRHQRNQQVQLQRHRRILRIYRRRVPANNVLIQMAQQLPLQITNDPFADQIFNGSIFF